MGRFLPPLGHRRGLRPCYKLRMSPTTAAIVVFALMWLGIGYGGFRLVRWLLRFDRELREGTVPYDPGL